MCEAGEWGAGADEPDITQRLITPRRAVQLDIGHLELNRLLTISWQNGEQPDKAISGKRVVLKVGIGKHLPLIRYYRWSRILSVAGGGNLLIRG